MCFEVVLKGLPVERYITYPLRVVRRERAVLEGLEVLAKDDQVD